MMNTGRPTGQTKSQGWQIGVSRTLPVQLEKAWEMMMAALNLPPEMLQAPDGIYGKGAILETADMTRIEIRSYEPYQLLRMKWQPKDWNTSSTLQIRVRPTRTKTIINVHHEWLSDAEQREVMRLHWTNVLETLKESVTKCE